MVCSVSYRHIEHLCLIKVYVFFRYFKALSAGEVAPVKNRLDNNPPANINDLTKGQLGVLHKQVNYCHC